MSPQPPQGAIGEPQVAPTPTPSASDRATAILAWVLEFGVMARYVGEGCYRACVRQQNGRIKHIGPAAYNRLSATSMAYDEYVARISAG